MGYLHTGYCVTYFLLGVIVEKSLKHISRSQWVQPAFGFEKHC